MAATMEKIQRLITGNISDGIIVISFDGTIMYANRAAYTTLDLTEQEMIGVKFASLFLYDPVNDDFTQTVLDAVNNKSQPQKSIVPYVKGGVKKYLRVVTSFFRGADGNAEAVCMIFSDLSELIELRDSMKTMDEISRLNRKLTVRNEALSKTFGMFLSDEIVAQLAAPGGLVPGGKKRVLTIMMSDLRGFTAISERMDPGDLIAMLNHYLEVMTGIIQDHKGTIIEFIGDGILAIFGAPVQTETHASDAVAAALGMEAAMDQVNLWNNERDYPILEMGIGINTGEVIVGNLGSEKRMKYGVAGKHVNICGRIESYTVGGQILISPDTRNAIKADLTVASEMTVLPKGAPEELVLTQVTGIGDPYNIHIQNKNDVPNRLREPVPVCFYKISEKHTIEKPYYGGITALGHNSAVLETETSLQLFENIEIKVAGQLFCKVKEKRDGSYLLYYTSIPSGFKNWAGNVLEENTSPPV